MYLLHKCLELLCEYLRLIKLLLRYLAVLQHLLYLLLRIALKRALKLPKTLHKVLELRVHAAHIPAERLKKRITHCLLPPSE